MAFALFSLHLYRLILSVLHFAQLRLTLYRRHFPWWVCWHMPPRCWDARQRSGPLSPSWRPGSLEAPGVHSDRAADHPLSAGNTASQFRLKPTIYIYIYIAIMYFILYIRNDMYMYIYIYTDEQTWGPGGELETTKKASTPPPLLSTKK